MDQMTPINSGTPRMSSASPAFNMRGSAIWPVAQASALGPVPEGSMKPQLAAIATGSASSTGSAPVAAISAASTGMMPLAVATLLANSVINMVSATIVAASRIVGTLPSGASTAPSQAASPLAVIAAASASQIGRAHV